MTSRRRAVFLVEMLTVLMILTAGGTLMAVGLASILRSHNRVAEFANRYAVLNDFLRCLSRDVRRATTASLHEGTGEGLRQVLVIGEMPPRVSYRFYQQHVERMGPEGGSALVKLWEPMSAEVGIGGPSDTVGRVIRVTVYWRRTGAKDPDSDRRFDLSVRCAGELGDDSAEINEARP